MDTRKEPHQQLLDQISAQHLQEIKKLWQKSTTPVTPARVQNNYALCDSQGNVLYSLPAIQRALDDIAATSAKGRPTAENRAARQATSGPTTSNPEHESPVAAPSHRETTRQTDIISIRVEFEDTFMNITISDNMSLDHFKNQVKEDMDFDTDVRLRVGYSTLQGWCLINSEATWVEALRNNIRTIQIRVRTDATNSSSAASTASTVSSAAQPLHLPFAQEAKFQVQKQWEYETKVRNHIKERVTARLTKDGDTVGSSAVTSSVTELMTLLRICSQLAEEWTSFCLEMGDKADGLDEHKLLEWFISAVINKFHTSIAQAWQSNDPVTRAKRLPAAFGSFNAFLAQLYLTVKPGVSGAPSSVLPALLADLQGRWQSFQYRREICGELRQMLVAVQFLQDHLFTGSAGDMTMTIKIFLESTLAEAVQIRLVDVLKQHHSADLPPIFRESDDYPQIQAYHLESVLRRWAAMDTMQGVLRPEEFKGPTTRAPSNSAEPGNRSSARDGGAPSGAALPTPSAKEFQVAGITFRQNLASLPDQHDRLREEAKFLEVVYQFDGVCHTCNRPGHRQVGCPERFKLDPKTGQDLNPKSYFYTLIPPRAALEAGKPRNSSGGGSIRNSRGSSGRSALAAVLEATARLETKMELMSREQQRDHDRVEQVAQQMGQHLGNDRAGAAH